MADNVSITPGSGAVIAADDVSGIMYQRLKLDMGGDGVALPAFGDATYGLAVDVKRVTGNVTVVQATASNLKVDASGATVPVSDAGGSLTVDAPVGTPVFVRLSDGTSAISTLPVSGGVTAAQGTAAAASGAWMVKLTDGTSTVGISTVGSDKALKVDVVQSVAVSGTPALADNAAFTMGTTKIDVIGGLYKDSGLTDPSAGQAAAARITLKRGLHVNLRADAGTEIGTSGAPLRVDVTGTTAQPVTQSVANWTVDITKIAGTAIVAAAAGIAKVGIADATGTTFSDTNPLPVKEAPRTRITKYLTLTASQTALDVWDPTSTKKFVVTSVVLAISVAGTLTFFDDTDAAANRLMYGLQATGNREYSFGGKPWKSATADNNLKYTSGTGLTGEVAVHGYEE